MVMLAKERLVAGQAGRQGSGGERLRPVPARLVLASSSPRRRKLLADAGYQFEVVEPTIDDAALAQGPVDAAAWVASLAYLKARAGLDRGRREMRNMAGVTVLGADTLVVDGARVLGKPRDAAEAEAILRSLLGRTHQVVTGVALVDAATGDRELATDRAEVRFGAVDEERIAAHIGSGAWKGKAGGYNMEELVCDGWPVSCLGDAGTVVGLPMRWLAPRLARFRAG